MRLKRTCGGDLILFQLKGEKAYLSLTIGTSQPVLGLWFDKNKYRKGVHIGLLVIQLWICTSAFSKPETDAI